MANILLMQIDGRMPNLALKTVERYHLDKGDAIQWDMPLMASWADEIYVSCVFTWNRNQCLEWEGRAHIGGTGYDLLAELPPEMADVKPRINLGFTTRGCIRNCKFCVVPEKEGKLHIVGDLMDLWDGKSKEIILWDNNVLGEPEHFIKICRQAQEYDIALDWNQGLDHRLLTDDVCKEMKKTKKKGIRRFAFDHPSNVDTVQTAIEMLKKHKLGQAKWYVLVGFNTTLEEDLFRLNYLRDRGHAVYVQIYNRLDETLKPMARWASMPRFFFNVPFVDWFNNQYQKSKDKYPRIVEYLAGRQEDKTTMKASTQDKYRVLMLLSEQSKAIEAKIKKRKAELLAIMLKDEQEDIKGELGTISINHKATVVYPPKVNKRIARIKAKAEEDGLTEFKSSTFLKCTLPRGGKKE